MTTRTNLIVACILLVGSASGFAAVQFVNLDSPTPTPPYSNWATAARAIQDAVDAAAAGDEIVVTNGTYAIGGRPVGTNQLANRVAVDKPLTLRSVNGPQFTVIQGYQVPGTTNGEGAIRCVYLANGASLSGFTLTNGATREEGYDDSELSGGGLWCESTGVVVSNCVVAGNSASYMGAGAYSGTLNYCTLRGNSAVNDSLWGGMGGGAALSTLNNCVVSGNSAGEGGGAAGGILNGCILIDNVATWGGGAFGGPSGGMAVHTEQLYAHPELGVPRRRDL